MTITEDEHNAYIKKPEKKTNHVMEKLRNDILLLTKATQIGTNKQSESYTHEEVNQSPQQRPRCYKRIEYHKNDRKKLLLITGNQVVSSRKKAACLSRSPENFPSCQLSNPTQLATKFYKHISSTKIFAKNGFYDQMKRAPTYISVWTHLKHTNYPISTKPNGFNSPNMNHKI